MTLTELREAITDAEEEHIAHGIIVQVKADDLLKAVEAQTMSRRRLQALRSRLFVAEAK